MNFTYHFPAVRGLQAGREYYISMVPLKLLSRLFPAEEEIILPEFRAQRRINESRIPEIKRYILNNRDTYKLPLFMVLHYLLKRKDLRDAFPYKTMKKFLTNYYVSWLPDPSVL